MNEKIIMADLSYEIVGAAMEVHRELGNGFLEKVYENALMVMFRKLSLEVVQQNSITVLFKEEIVGNYIADILVENKIILELKVIDKITNIHRAQVLNYLKATNVRLAIILNFKNRSLEYERIIL